MAKQYFALSQIQAGVDNDVKVFEVGDQVVGLPKEQMVSLWNAGVLTEKDPDATPPDDRDEKIAALEKELHDLRLEKAAPVTPEGESPEGESPDVTPAEGLVTEEEDKTVVQ